MYAPRGRGGWRGRQNRLVRNVSGDDKVPMQYVPSVSRSSGLDKDGDALKNYKVQEEYRQFIQTKLDDLAQRRTDESEYDQKMRHELQENSMILLRKLREGIYASSREDEFSLEVYETSLYYSLIFNSPLHIPSVAPRLLSVLSPKYSDVPNQSVVVTLCLLHHLVVGFPSQLAYRQTWLRIPPTSQFPGTSMCLWLKKVARDLRTCNYTSFERSTRRHSLPSFDHVTQNLLATQALTTLICSLRARARRRHWATICSAYRELILHPQAESRTWLARCLAMPLDDLDDWLEAGLKKGSLRKKEGVEGRYIVIKGR